MPPTPLLDSFKRGDVERDARLLAAQGELAPRALEQLQILVMLLGDLDAEIKAAAEVTLGRVPVQNIRAVLTESDVPASIREFFASRGIAPAAGAAVNMEAPLIDTAPGDIEEEVPADAEPGQRKESVVAQLTRMNFPQRLQAAVKGTREMRAILIRDPNKMISAGVLASPRLTENEVEAFARMAQLSEDTLRAIGTNRTWIKNYSVVLGLTKNPKTPLAMSLNMMPRLKDRDLSLLSMDRNVPEPLRIAARKRMSAGVNGRKAED
jgi:hypothetical protein